MTKVLHCEICGVATRSRRARFCDECRPSPRPLRGAITERDYIVEDRGYESPCWIWKGRNPENPDYGKIRIGNRTTVAHVVSFQQFVGPIPEGLQLDHLCRVKRCINPSHLEPVTGAENIRRGSSAKLDRESVSAIRSSSDSTPVLARRYGVHPETIGYLRRGKTWT